MEILCVIKRITKKYSKKQSILNLMYYIHGTGKNEENELCKYIIARGVIPKPEESANQMIAIQKLYGKTKGRRVNHWIISFSEDITDFKVVTQVADAVADYFFKDYQVFGGVHTSTDNLHIHFAVNTVSYIDGIKWHKSRRDFKDFRQNILDIVNSLMEQTGYQCLDIKEQTECI